jgi:two-component system chemotaxis response regulator CheB
VANRDLVVVGASAGGVEALIRVVSELPSNFPAAILVVLHTPADAPSNLPAILGRAGPLRSAHARDDEPIEPGRILVAPPDRHLLVHDGRVRLSSGPFENLHRPAVDVLFRSAAINRDGCTVGVVLSGALDDGAAGLRTIALAGGLAVVQDPGDALFPSMPRSAIEAARVDHVLPADEIGRKLPELLGAPVGKNAMDERTKETLEQESLSRRMLDRHWGSGAERSPARLKQRSDELGQRADVLRRFLTIPVVGTFADDDAHAGSAPSAPVEEARAMGGQRAG